MVLGFVTQDRRLIEPFFILLIAKMIASLERGALYRFWPIAKGMGPTRNWHPYFKG